METGHCAPKPQITERHPVPYKDPGDGGLVLSRLNPPWIPVQSSLPADPVERRVKGGLVQIGGLERVRLGVFPTPLQELGNLGARLGGPRLFVKRDDLSGLGLGGNKLRKLEYAFAEARRLEATTVITSGAIQSNHVRLTAAAANKLGLSCHAVLRGEAPERATGNFLVDRILGVSSIRFVSGEVRVTSKAGGSPVDIEAERLAEELRGAGEVPYVIPNGCKALHGALGYAGCVLEIVTQLRERGLPVDAVVAGCGTSSTQTGLILGSWLYTQAEMSVVGISISGGSVDLCARIDAQLDEAVTHLGIPRSGDRESIVVLDDFVGEGYGVPTEGMKEAVRLVARTEGILLDPVYTGKAMAGLISWVREGRFASDQTVVFLHTGGAPGLFAESQAETFQA